LSETAALTVTLTLSLVILLVGSVWIYCRWRRRKGKSPRRINRSDNRFDVPALINLGRSQSKNENDDDKMLEFEAFAEMDNPTVKEKKEKKIPLRGANQELRG